jgi:hypothetical protein
MLKLLFNKKRPQKIARITHLRYWHPRKEWSIRVEIGKEWYQPVISFEFAHFLFTENFDKDLRSRIECDEQEFVLTLK